VDGARGARSGFGAPGRIGSRIPAPRPPRPRTAATRRDPAAAPHAMQTNRTLSAPLARDIRHDEVNLNTKT
jgi:hypothetical protein